MPTEPTAAAEEAWEAAFDKLLTDRRAAGDTSNYMARQRSGFVEGWFAHSLAASPPPSEADAALVAEATRYLRDYADGLDESGAYNHAANVLRFTRRLAARLQAAPPARKS